MKVDLATIDTAPIQAGTRVLMRVDYNVPVVDGVITDDKRMVDNLPTIKYCLQKGARVILCSHFGRPEGKPDPLYSLKLVSEHLRELLPDVAVQFAPDCVGATVERMVADMPERSVLLLENTRFHAGETANEPAFAQALAKLGAVFVNDAFGTAHRAHASTVGVTQYLPSYAGLLMAREVNYLSKLTDHCARPFTVIVGGKKVTDKMPLVEHLVDVADYILIGGKIAAEWNFTRPHRAQILVAAGKGKDITPATVDEWRPIIEQSKTIFWNGPLGQFEDPQYAVGTRQVARLVADTRAVTVVGGGDTAAAVKGYQFNYVSTGGGAALEFVQGVPLVGIKCLIKKGAKGK